MPEVLPFIRALHVIAASSWLGEVIVINFVLIPLVARNTGEIRKQFIITLFPRLFRLASILSATTVLTGAYLLHVYTQDDFTLLLNGRWGLGILIGGSLGLLLTLFHFFMENKLAKRIGIVKKTGSADVLEDVHLKLRIVPRLGLVVIVTAYLLMLYAVRGW